MSIMAENITKEMKSLSMLCQAVQRENNEYNNKSENNVNTKAIMKIIMAINNEIM